MSIFHKLHDCDYLKEIRMLSLSESWSRVTFILINRVISEPIVLYLVIEMGSLNIAFNCMRMRN